MLRHTLDLTLIHLAYSACAHNTGTFLDNDLNLLNGPPTSSLWDLGESAQLNQNTHEIYMYIIKFSHA